MLRDFVRQLHVLADAGRLRTTRVRRRVAAGGRATPLPDLARRASDLASKINSTGFEIASVNSVDPEAKLRISLTLLNAVSNLSMGTGAEQNRLFAEAEKMGVHIKRPHFYSPLPTVSELDESLWEETNDAGIDWNDDRYLELLGKLSAFTGDFRQIVESGRWDPSNPAFSHYDAIIYYCMIRHLKPLRIVEVGAGYSTQLASLAATDTGTSITCVEPYPSDALRGLDVRLLKRRVQDVDMKEFESLRSGDVLFVDSSHVAKIGSDVNHLFLKVLPRLADGVNVHVHDIAIPKTYGAQLTRDLCTFWNEQYVLHAFLMHNSKWDVTLPVHRMSVLWLDSLEAACPTPTGMKTGGSFWMRKHS